MKLAFWTVFLFVLGVKGGNVCYDKIGCFSSDKPWSGTLERPIERLPSSPQSINVRLILYTKDHLDDSQVINPLSPDTIVATSFKTTRKSRFIIHGFIDSGDKNWLSDMCKTMLQVEDVNCFCVDWSGGSRALYTQASNNVRVVGAVVAYFITFLGERFGYSPSLVHVIGHSLGAQTAGEVGKRRPGIGRITALDPAEPYFQGTPPEVRVDPTDAAFVDVIHTDSSSVILHLGTNGYGMSQLVGHLDFFPNGGEQMPGCIPNSLDKILDIDRIFEGGTIPCNHLRSYKYYTDSILRPDGFTGFAADSYQAFKLGVGFPCPSSGCPIMGHYADRYRGVAPADQKYFLNTGADKPFARWRYKVTIKIDGVRDILGNLDVALLGTSGTSEAQRIYTGLIHVGDAYSAFIDSETDVGSLMRVKFYWNNTMIYIFKIGFYPQTITVQNGRDGRTYKFCGNPNNNDQIQTIEACS